MKNRKTGERENVALDQDRGALRRLMDKRPARYQAVRQLSSGCWRSAICAPRRKEGFISVISLFSFLGIMLGVATLIVVMAVLNGFRAELLDKILGFTGHVSVYTQTISARSRISRISRRAWRRCTASRG